MSTKFRPYFTIEELDETIRCVSISSQNLHLLHYLRSFGDKISLGKISPNLSLAPAKPSFADSLELSEPNSKQKPTPTNPSNETLRQAAYIKWSINPETCTITELALVQTYRFENDLMSPEEETEFLSTLSS